MLVSGSQGSASPLRALDCLPLAATLTPAVLSRGSVKGAAATECTLDTLPAATTLGTRGLLPAPTGASRERTSAASGGSVRPRPRSGAYDTLCEYTTRLLR